MVQVIVDMKVNTGVIVLAGMTVIVWVRVFVVV
jgi:hypothetical protein